MSDGAFHAVTHYSKVIKVINRTPRYIASRLFHRSGATRSMAFHAPCRARLADLDGTSGVYRYGTGLGPGVGATPQMADAQGGRGGVGMRNSLP